MLASLKGVNFWEYVQGEGRSGACKEFCYVWFYLWSTSGYLKALEQGNIVPRPTFLEDGNIKLKLFWCIEGPGVQLIGQSLYLSWFWLTSLLIWIKRTEATQWLFGKWSCIHFLKPHVFFWGGGGYIVHTLAPDPCTSHPTLWPIPWNIKKI